MELRTSNSITRTKSRTETAWQPKEEDTGVVAGNKGCAEHQISF